MNVMCFRFSVINALLQLSDSPAFIMFWELYDEGIECITR